ncbi:heme d1 biosynthesis radical SAM protein NirJ [Rhodovibrionaceae bacterium A322]
MFRLSHYLRQLDRPTAVRERKGPIRPVVIWNLIRRCNLKCRHCYAVSADVDFPGELSPNQAMTVLEDLAAMKIPALILSGGEPLLRPDIFDISRRAKKLGLYTALSTNGTPITAELADKVAAIGYDYVGISLDGIGKVNDWFRGQKGAFDEALQGLRNCRDRGVKVGVRFTLTEDNADQFPLLLDLVEEEKIDKFYLSHLVYSGRGNKNRAEDADWSLTRNAMETLFERAWKAIERGEDRDYVTGNNDADGVFLLTWAAQRFSPKETAHLRQHLEAWGGNASGLGVANIDNLGQVHPDTYWPGYTLGNVKERPFSEIWSRTDDPLLTGLRQRPRQIKGRCGDCGFFSICGGNTRVRALQLTGDPWAEDPACYLNDREIDRKTAQTQLEDRLTLRPFRGRAHEATHHYS